MEDLGRWDRASSRPRTISIELCQPERRLIGMPGNSDRHERIVRGCWEGMLVQ